LCKIGNRLLDRLLDLNRNDIDIVLRVLLSWNWGNFYLEGVFANRRVGGVPVEGDSGSIGANHKKHLTKYRALDGILV